MTHNEKREFLIRELLAELPQYSKMELPDNENEQKRLLRSLMNIRAPRPVSDEFLQIQDEYLSEEVVAKGLRTVPCCRFQRPTAGWFSGAAILQR